MRFTSHERIAWTTSSVRDGRGWVRVGEGAVVASPLGVATFRSGGPSPRSQPARARAASNKESRPAMSLQTEIREGVFPIAHNLRT